MSAGRRFVALALVSGLGLACPPEVALANAVTKVSASADWSTFAATLDGTPIGFEYSRASFVFGKAEYVDNASSGVTANTPDWGSTDAKEQIPNALGHGYTTADSINGDGTGIADGVVNSYGRGAGYAYRIGYFDLRRAGADQIFDLLASLSFSFEHFFDYDLATDTVGAYNTYNIGLGYVDDAGITQTLLRPSGEYKHYGFQGSTWCNGGSDCNGSWTHTDTLQIATSVAGGRLYAIDAFVLSDASSRTTAVVPEPATLALLGIGLAAALGQRRRLGGPLATST